MSTYNDLHPKYWYGFNIKPHDSNLNVRSKASESANDSFVIRKALKEKQKEKTGSER